MSTQTIDKYDAHKQATTRRIREISRAGRDISPLPRVKSSARKKKSKKSFLSFCDSYFPDVFTLKWSKDHLKVIAKAEKAILDGGLFALAMPRGSGKTTIAETAALWAMIYGHHEFICLVGSSEASALEMLDSVKAELENNELLLEDFPEVVYPIHCLEGIAHRAKGQLLNSRRTQIHWTATEIVLPSIPKSPASGIIVKTTGITGRIRGMKFKRPDGRSSRPSLVIIDDPQTDESARSPSQCQTRESILAGAVLGLAGPGKKIAGLMPCTVIRPDDMADRILDPETHPQWQGERTKLIYEWPVNESLWQEYADIRDDHFREGGDGSRATEFYKTNRDGMDKGAIIAWPERFNEDELSAIQHAWNLRLRDESAFFSEYQNEPLPAEDEGASLMLDSDEFLKRQNGMARREVPAETTHLTAMIDVQKKALYYSICAWSDNFTGCVIDFGTWPDQKRDYFTLTDVRTTIQRKFPGVGLEGTIHGSLEKLVDKLMGGKYHRDDGVEMPIQMCLIDANWGASTDTVYQFVRGSIHKANLMPSHGKYYGASSIPMNEYRKKRGDRIGHNWRCPNVRGRRVVRYVLFDANYWKTFLSARFNTQKGDHGALTVFNGPENRMRLLSDHLQSEFSVRTEGRGRTCDEWKIKPQHFDNHWLDCLVGCCVGASMLGCQLKQTSADFDKKTRAVRKNRVSYL